MGGGGTGGGGRTAGLVARCLQILVEVPVGRRQDHLVAKTFVDAGILNGGLQGSFHGMGLPLARG